MKKITENIKITKKNTEKSLINILLFFLKSFIKKYIVNINVKSIMNLALEKERILINENKEIIKIALFFIL